MPLTSNCASRLRATQVQRPPPPPLPSIHSIPVEEYAGKRLRHHLSERSACSCAGTRQVRRPQFEIDRDRDRIYNRMRDEHTRLMADYRSYDTDYNKRLTSWRARTTPAHRAEQREGGTEVKRNQLVEANKAIKDDQKDSTKDLSAKRTETEQEEFEVELLNIAVQTIRAGKPHSAFRPRYFESLNWTQEKSSYKTLSPTTMPELVCHFNCPIAMHSGNVGSSLVSSPAC